MSLANTLATQLQEAELLICENEGRDTAWLVSLRVRGFGPNLEQYEQHDIPHSVLPEFVVAPTLVDLQPAEEVPPAEEEPQLDGSTPPAEAEVQPIDEGGTEVATAAEGADQATEPTQLQVAYDYIRGIAQESTEVEGDFTKFKSPFDLKKMLSTRLGIPTPRSVALLGQLRNLEVYRSDRGPSPDRYLRLDEAAQQIVASANGGGKSKPKGSSKPTAPKPASPPAEPPTDGASEGVELSPEQLVKMVEQSAEKLNEYSATIDRLTAERDDAVAGRATAIEDLAELQETHNEVLKELEDLRSAPPVVRYVVSESVATLVKHLDDQG